MDSEGCGAESRFHRPNAVADRSRWYVLQDFWCVGIAARPLQSTFMAGDIGLLPAVHDDEWGYRLVRRHRTDHIAVGNRGSSHRSRLHRPVRQYDHQQIRLLHVVQRLPSGQPMHVRISSSGLREPCCCHTGSELHARRSTRLTARGLRVSACPVVPPRPCPCGTRATPRSDGRAHRAPLTGLG